MNLTDEQIDRLNGQWLGLPEWKETIRGFSRAILAAAAVSASWVEAG